MKRANKKGPQGKSTGRNRRVQFTMQIGQGDVTDAYSMDRVQGRDSQQQQIPMTAGLPGKPWQF